MERKVNAEHLLIGLGADKYQLERECPFLGVKVGAEEFWLTFL